MPKQHHPGLDDRLSLKKAAKHVPSIVYPGKFETKSYFTIYRWTTKGSRGVKLQCVRDAQGQRFTTRRWMLEFLRKLQDDLAGAEEIAPSPRSVEAELDSLGV